MARRPVPVPPNPARRAPRVPARPPIPRAVRRMEEAHRFLDSIRASSGIRIVRRAYLVHPEVFAELRLLDPNGVNAEARGFFRPDGYPGFGFWRAYKVIVAPDMPSEEIWIVDRDAGRVLRVIEYGTGQTTDRPSNMRNLRRVILQDAELLITRRMEARRSLRAAPSVGGFERALRFLEDENGEAEAPLPVDEAVNRFEGTVTGRMSSATTNVSSAPRSAGGFRDTMPARGEAPGTMHVFLRDNSRPRNQLLQIANQLNLAKGVLMRPDMLTPREQEALHLFDFRLRRLLGRTITPELQRFVNEEKATPVDKVRTRVRIIPKGKAARRRRVIE